MKEGKQPVIDEDYGLIDELDKLGVYLPGGAVDLNGLRGHTIARMRDRLDLTDDPSDL